MPSHQDLSPLLDHPWSAALRTAAPGRPVHLVGGAIRDVWLGARQLADLDVTVDRQATELAQRLQELVPARLVVLGRKEHSALRLVPRDASLGDLDLWDRQGGDLHADLERRDFTLHAVAVDVHSGKIIDPFGGLEDLQGRVLRETTPRTLFEDPQRTVRLVRLVAQLLDFSIDSVTRSRAIAAAPLLSQVAAERVAAELTRWTQQPRFLAGAGLLADLPPFAAVGRSLEDLERLAQLLSDRNDPPAEVREATIWSVVERLAPSEFIGWQECGWVSSEVVRAVRRHRETGPIPRLVADRREWIFAHRAGWRSAALAALAVLDSTEAQATLGALERLAEDESLFAVRGLVSGEDLLRLGIPAGPALGGLLVDLRRREVRGELGDREQALRLARDQWRRITSASSDAD